MAIKTYYLDGIKAVNINSLPDDAWDIIGGSDSDDDSILGLYHSSAFFRRCVDLRAQSLSRLPRDIMRGDEPIDETDEPLLKDLTKHLFQIEVAMVLYGYAYLLKERNRVAATNVRWAAPQSITPQYDTKNALTGFKRGLGGEPIDLSVEDLLYFWTPPISAEVGPGKPVGMAAAKSANVLEGTTLFSKGFFERGAVFPMLLSVEGNPPPEEMEKMRKWWMRLARGVKDAWTTIAVRASVTPQIIGPPIKDMAMKDLNELQRENVATALGIPHSLIMSNAANYATAGQDYINFYDMTIIPEAELIADVFNNQLLNDLGLKLVFQPSRLEVFQQSNLDTADKVSSLVTSNIIDKNEAREILGYEPLDDIEDEPEQPIVMQLPEPVAEQPEPIQDEMRLVDLEKWQRKALSNLKANDMAAAYFESDHISHNETSQIIHELALCYSPSEVKAVFDERLS